MVGIKPEDVVHTGGGFRQQDHGGRAVAIPGAAREEGERAGSDAGDRNDEHYIGGARPAIQGRVKVGFGKGCVTAMDMFVPLRQRPA